MCNTWQAFQWFDLEAGPASQLEATCKTLKQSGKQFDNQIVEQLLKDSPFDEDVDVKQLVDQFNDMLHTLH
jgi:hypothetical protein